jgi:hypothetical protein
VAITDLLNTAFAQTVQETPEQVIACSLTPVRFE